MSTALVKVGTAPLAMPVRGDDVAMGTTLIEAGSGATAAVPNDRILRSPEFFAHLATDLPEGHIAKKIGLFKNIAPLRRLLEERAALIPAEAKARIAFTGGLLTTGLGFVTDAILSGAISHAPGLGLIGLGATIALKGIHGMATSRAAENRLSEQQKKLESTPPARRKIVAMGAGQNATASGDVQNSPSPNVSGLYGLPDLSGIPDFIRDMLTVIPSGNIDGRAVGACYMMKQPLTNEQFERIMGRKSNSHQANGYGYGTFHGPKQAVVMTTRQEFAEVAKKMTELCRGAIVFGFPKADQAQLGAQGGKNHEYPTKSGRFSTREMNTWEGYQERKKRDPNATATVDVTQYDPNDYGLYPGDVWIFCEGGLLCGGSWDFNADGARAAYRHGNYDGAGYDRGWRGVGVASAPGLD